jgi:hypothetical protein
MEQALRPFIMLLILVCTLGMPVSAHATPSAGSVQQQAVETHVLTAAYPNPFNATTRFSLTVHHRQQVAVEVYNMLGQPVAHLFRGVMEADETRTFTIDGSALSTGIYFYRIHGETFAAARQVTLLK